MKDPKSRAFATAARLYEECYARGCSDDELAKRMAAAYDLPEAFVRSTQLPMNLRFVELLTLMSGGVTYGSEDLIGQDEFVRRAFALGRTGLIPYIVKKGYNNRRLLAFSFARLGRVDEGAQYARAPEDFAALIYGALHSGDVGAYNAAINFAPAEAEAALDDGKLLVHAIAGRDPSLIDAVLDGIDDPGALDFAPLLAAALGLSPEIDETARQRAEFVADMVLVILVESVTTAFVSPMIGSLVSSLYKGVGAAARATEGYLVDYVIGFFAEGAGKDLSSSVVVSPYVYEKVGGWYRKVADWGTEFAQKRFNSAFDYIFGSRDAKVAAAREKLFAKILALAPPGARIDWAPVAIAAVAAGDPDLILKVGRAIPRAAREALDATDALTLALARDDALFAAAARAFPGPRDFGALLRAAALLKSTAKFARVVKEAQAEGFGDELAAALESVPLDPEFEAQLVAENILAG